MIDFGLGIRGCLPIPTLLWNENVPTRLIWDIKEWSTTSTTREHGVWATFEKTQRMICVLLNTGLMARNAGNLEGTEYEVLRRVKLPSVQGVIKTIQAGISKHGKEIVVNYARYLHLLLEPTVTNLV